MNNLNISKKIEFLTEKGYVINLKTAPNNSSYICSQKTGNIIAIYNNGKFILKGNPLENNLEILLEQFNLIKIAKERDILYNFSEGNKNEERVLKICEEILKL